MSNCGSCSHWDRFECGDALGNCRRHPPVIVPSLAILDAPNRSADEIQPETIHFATRFPITSSSEGCGEWDSAMPLC